MANERPEAGRERQAREAVEAELWKWTAGGPLARALRSLVYRRGGRPELAAAEGSWGGPTYSNRGAEIRCAVKVGT